MNLPENWHNLSPRQQLRDAVQAYARLSGRELRLAWFDLERRYWRKYGVNLSEDRKRYASRHGCKPTIPLWIEQSGIMDRCIALALTMWKSC